MSITQQTKQLLEVVQVNNNSCQIFVEGEHGPLLSFGLEEHKHLHSLRASVEHRLPHIPRKLHFGFVIQQGTSKILVCLQIHDSPTL